MPGDGNSTCWPRKTRGWVSIRVLYGSGTDTHRIRSSVKYLPHMPGSIAVAAAAAHIVRLTYTYSTQSRISPG